MRFWLLVAVALVIPSCGTRIIVPEDVGTVDRVYEDLPAPEGFKYEKNIVNTSPTGSFRVLTHILRGADRRVEATVKFYKDIYDTHGWKLESADGPAKGPVKLVFLKKDERCAVEIKDEPAAVVVTLKVNRK